MRIAVVGSKGMVGSAILKEWNGPRIRGLFSTFEKSDELIPLDLPEFDLTSRRFVLDEIAEIHPDVVINAAGLNFIDWLETHPNTARTVHVQGTANLREAARRVGALLVHFSCGEVFYSGSETAAEMNGEGEENDDWKYSEIEENENKNGSAGIFESGLILPRSLRRREGIWIPGAGEERGLSPQKSAPQDRETVSERLRENASKTEADLPNPASIYAKTKLESERAASEYERHLIVRASGLFGFPGEQGAGNLVDTVLKASVRSQTIRVINDVVTSPTFVLDLLRALYPLVRAEKTGLYHLANGEAATLSETAEFLLKACGLKRHRVEGISLADYGGQAPRSQWTALSSVRYGELSDGYAIPDWQTAIREFLEIRNPGF